MNTFTDPRDKKEYQTVQIGDQIWMAENLDFAVGSGSCYATGNQENRKNFGRLYNWETARKVAPPGWRLPEVEDFNKLIDFLGGREFAYLKLTHGGSSGFNAVLCEWKDYQGYFTSTVEFTQPGDEQCIESTRFWSANKCDPASGCKNHAHYLHIDNIVSGNYSADRNALVATDVYPIKGFFSVRCIKALARN